MPLPQCLGAGGERGGDDLPVVVWICGGGFNVGSASMDNYQGEGLAQEGVICVSIAYRLGAMGYMAHPWLAAETEYGGSGNYGLMDQAFALQWIADNIEAFGGDPENVTITGQSAASMSLNALQVSPLAEGLFDKIFGAALWSSSSGPMRRWRPRASPRPSSLGPRAGRSCAPSRRGSSTSMASASASRSTVVSCRGRLRRRAARRRLHA